MQHRIDGFLLSPSLPVLRLGGTLDKCGLGQEDQLYYGALEPAITRNLLLVLFPPSEEAVYIHFIRRLLARVKGPSLPFFIPPVFSSSICLSKSNQHEKNILLLPDAEYLSENCR
jgi:hypothetical protein